MKRVENKKTPGACSLKRISGKGTNDNTKRWYGVRNCRLGGYRTVRF